MKPNPNDILARPLGGHRSEQSDRLFCGVYPTGIVYADRKRQMHGDYLRLAFLSFATLALEWEPVPMPEDLRASIKADAAAVQARKGEEYSVSSSGQVVRLGR